MGDRGNIIIEAQGEQSLFPNPIYFYTHWAGYDIPVRLQSALKKGRSRWDDGQYLARVIFQSLIGSDDSTTGYGITTAKGDGGKEYSVNIEARSVTRKNSGDKWTFDEFIALKIKEDVE